MQLASHSAPRPRAFSPDHCKVDSGDLARRWTRTSPKMRGLLVLSDRLAQLRSSLIITGYGNSLQNMHVTELAINKTFGMQLAPAGAGHVLEMPESPLLLNHVGTVHASAQF